MELTPINAETAPRPQAGYAQALAVEGAQRLLLEQWLLEIEAIAAA